MATKVCTKCEQEKPLDMFGAHKRARDGKHTQCRACRIAVSSAWAKAHPERMKELRLKYWAENGDRIRANKRVTDKNYREGRKAERKAYDEAHRDRINQLRRESRSANPQKYYQAVERWKAKHRDHFLALSQNVTARQRAKRSGANKIDLTHQEWRAIKETYEGRCVYCGDHPEKLTQDHRTPLSRGGNHTASNVVPACPKCNSRKGNRTAEEFLTQGVTS